MSHSTRSLPPRLTDASDAEPDFVELPQTAASPVVAATDGSAPPRHRSAATTTGLPPRRKNATPALRTASDDEDQRSWTERTLHRFLGDEGAAYAISLVMHIILLAILAIPILHSVREGPIFTTIIADAEEQSSDFTELIDTELTLPEDVLGGAASRELPELNLNTSKPLTTALFEGAGALSEGEGAGTLNDGALKFVPENAVTAGSFTAWTTPIRRRFGEPDPKPGDSPRPDQPYWITIQIKVPEGRRTYPVSDLSGVVIGTDNYKQKIPQDRRSRQPRFFVINEEGEAVQPKRTVRVVDGRVQFRVKVPGARSLVKDTIEVSSRMLDEAQTLELVFE